MNKVKLDRMIHEHGPIMRENVPTIWPDDAVEYEALQDIDCAYVREARRQSKTFDPEVWGRLYFATPYTPCEVRTMADLRACNELDVAYSDACHEHARS